jgi:dihydropteroate synthase
MSAESNERQSARPLELTTAHGPIRLGERCLVMGVLNVTPDSFSDGGLHLDPAVACRRALEMAEEGADLIDVGGESTRPGSSPVPKEAQLERVVPVIVAVRRAGLTLPISIDTRLAAVAEAALEAGADVVNDVSAGRADAAMPGLLAERRVPFVAMHMRGSPADMQVGPTYGDVSAEVAAFFEERASALESAGVDCGKMIVDPGIGFGKRLEHNLVLLREMDRWRGRWPVLIGPSRKRFLGEILGEKEPGGRLFGTAAVVAHCALAGVEMVRVHDVGEMRQVVEVCARFRE